MSDNFQSDKEKEKEVLNSPEEKEDATAQENESQEPDQEPEEETVETKLARSEAEVADLKDRLLRQMAEFDNYRKRTMKEKAELILNGGEKTITAILPVLDDFERALVTMQKATDVDAVKEGVALIYNKFVQILGQNGVKAIETKEKELDTDFHDAIAIIDAPSEELKGKILDCVETGYMLNDKVIRHAKVVVGK